MTPIRKSGDANVALTTLKRRSGSAWTSVQNGYRRAAGAWVKVYSAYTPISSVTASPASATASATRLGASAPGSLVVTAGVTINVTGGSGSYTYSAALLSGTAMTVAPGANTSFSATLARNQTITATYRITVSDGQSSGHVDVPVSLNYDWESGA